MAGSSFGTLFRITTWGESHGSGIGVVIDGCPAGLPLEASDIQKFLNRRKPGQNRFSTARKEGDLVEILSGVFEGKTTGTPISLLVRNTDQRSHDYGNLAFCYRPGHADYTYDQKYGFRDYRGGGRSSGRETIGRVAAGAVAARLLSELGVTITAYTRSIGPVEIETFDREQITRNTLSMPDEAAAQKAAAYLDDCMKDKNSSGGCIECIVHGLPAGLGDPVFEKLDANLAKALMSVGSVKGVEIGDGFSVIKATGRENNDGFVCRADGKIEKLTNHAGGILGGISDGSDLIIRAAVKPTPSIFSEQDTVTASGENIKLNIKGRHDPVIVPRAVVVIESMTAVTLADALLLNMSAKMEHIKKIYQ